MTAFWVFLALLVGAVACRVAWTRGHEAGYVKGRALRSEVDYDKGRLSVIEETFAKAEDAEAARLATIRENRSAGSRRAWETRKAQRAARGES